MLIITQDDNIIFGNAVTKIERDGTTVSATLVDGSKETLAVYTKEADAIKEMDAFIVGPAKAWFKFNDEKKVVEEPEEEEDPEELDPDDGEG